MMRDPIHPGETLGEGLDALGMSAAELARCIKVPVNRITEILNGRRAVTGDTALRLGRYFGTSGEFWLNLQKLHELPRAEQKNGARDRAVAVAGFRRPPAGFGVRRRRRTTGGIRQPGRELCVDPELHAAMTAWSTRRAANWIEATMSSRSRSGISSSICSKDNPLASRSRTSVTRILIPRMQGRPPHWFGLNVIRSPIWGMATSFVLQFREGTFPNDLA